ncbi:MAG: hypothetical protein AAB290_06600 [Candidatus Eisenbacteria bacterium]
MSRGSARAGRTRRAGPAAPRPPGAPPTISAQPLSPTHPAALIATLVAVACVLVSVSFHLYDADAWQNLAFGKAIWTLGKIPHTQIFTWPNFGAPLVNPSWGFTALVWPFWSVGGVTGLFVWRWLTTLIVFAVLWITARRLGAVGLTPLWALVVCALIYRQRSQIRPETLASVWFALTLWLLEVRRQGGPDRSVWLIAVAWAWANSHISYYVGFLLLGIHLLDGLIGRGSAGAPSTRRLWLVALAMAVVSFANPYGWQTLARPFQYLLVWRHEPMWRVISEIKPVDWRINLANGLPVVMAGWPLLALWRWRRRGVDRVELLMCGAFTVLGLSSSRFIATYALAAAPYLARDLDALVRTWPRPSGLARPWHRAALVSALCIAVGWREWTRYQGPIGVAFDLRHTPKHACDFMAAHGVRGRGFNHFYLGGSQMWHFWPDRERLPFMSGSPEDSSPEIRDLYYRAISSPEGWRDLDARYRFDYALLSRRYTDHYGLLDLIDADPTWAVVFVDDVAAVYLRREGPLAAVADSFAYRLVTGGRTRNAALVERAKGDTALRAALIAELERQARETTRNLYGRQMLRAIGPPLGR